MNWSVFLIVVLLNSLLCSLQYLVERIDKTKGRIVPRHSIIPGTDQKFLYWEDFYTQTYGDFFGLVWIMNGFAHLLIKGQITSLEWFIFIFFTLVSIFIFLYSNLKSGHKPDWGYPSQGRISWGGITHLPYFGSLFAMSILCLINIFSGEIRGVLLWTTLSGGFIYIITIIVDIKLGHFDSIKNYK